MYEKVWYDIKMTSRNTPAPYVVSASSMYRTNYDGWKAFDGLLFNSVGNARWLTKDGTKTGYITIRLDQLRVVNLIQTDMSQSGSTLFPTQMAIHGSNDGATFNKIASFSRPIETLSEQEFDNKTPYLYYKIEILANNGGNYTGLTEIKLGYVKKPIDKTFILHDSEYKQYHDDIYKGSIRDTSIFSNVDENFDSFISGNQETGNNSDLSKGTFRSINRSNNVSGIAYFGVKLKKTETLKTFIIRQGSDTSNSIPSVNIQGSNNGTAWTTFVSPSLSRTGATTTVNVSNFVKEPYLYYRAIASSNSTSTNTIWVVYVIDFIAEKNDIALVDTAKWEVVSDVLPTSQKFLEKGMSSLSPLFDRKTITLEPMVMTDKSEILGVGEIGKVFSKTIDLKKYIDIRGIRTEVE